MVSPYVPDRGDIVWIEFNPQSGREQAGRRPALILSPASYNRLSELALMCPITNRKKGYPFEVQMPENSPVSGVVLADQVKTADWRARNAQLIGTAPPAVFAEVQGKIAPLLGI